jgi:hypothetical protein
LPTSSVDVVSFIDIPHGLSARQTERYLRKNCTALKDFPGTKAYASNMIPVLEGQLTQAKALSKPVKHN